MEEQRLLKKKRKAAGNTTALISASTDLAAYYNSVEKYSKAVKEYEILSEIYKGQNKLILYAQANRGIGEAYMGLQEFEKALKHFKIYLNVSVSERNILEQQRALAQLGHMYLTWYLETINEDNKKLLDEAYCYFVKSMKKCESLPENVEKQDMLARLFSNLGLVKHSLGDYNTSLNLHEKGIKICLKHDLYEQLYRGYISMASLFEKQDKHQETIKNYNLAIETAKKLSSKKIELICAALLAKSETLIKIADFNGAKQVLRKAYKFKTPNVSERRHIEKYLRVVAGMCKVEDEMITCNDERQLKNLYEKMGDGACVLKNFVKAIEYYKKMLESAEKYGASDKELGECYYSLAETYKDNGQYKEAEIYFEKEYHLCKNSLKDSLNTLCKIADLKEMANNNINEIKQVYERGLANCRNKGNIKEEKRIITRYIDFLRRSLFQSEALKLEQYLNDLNGTSENDESSSSSEYESEDLDTKVHIGDDIVLSDVTDLSEDSDNEVPEPDILQPSKRRKQNTVKFKKNLNGEWPLHVACIKGNLKMVQYWLAVDHPVNVRDNAGWLPLHEAAVHGHLEIVRTLLDHKAWINDRGGSECNGITPLHDAASNGHLEVIELLLDRGASAVAKTDDGNTPLFELKRWYERTSPNLDTDYHNFYHRLIEKMSEALNRAGQKDVDKDTSELFDSESPEEENLHYLSTNVGRRRRYVCLDEMNLENDDEESLESCTNLSQASEKSLSNEYQLVMQTLRHKNYKKRDSVSPTRLTVVKRSAHVNAEEYVDDDWLDDDIRPMKQKKRKIDDVEKLWRRSRSFGEASGSSKSPRGTASSRVEDSFQHEEGEVVYTPEDFFSDEIKQDLFLNTPTRRHSNESAGSSASSLSRKKTQVTLLDSGFSKKRSSNFSGNKSSLRRRSSGETVCSTQPKITIFAHTSRAVAEADSTTLAPSQSGTHVVELTQNVTDPTLFVDVEIEGKLFRVPVLLSQIQSRPIKWLAEEAAQRYASKEYMKPTLELETTNGAVLADDDLLCLLFPMGSMQAEKVVAKVTEWSLPCLIDRYSDTCAHMSIDVDNDLCQLLQSLSVSLDLSNHGILCEHLTPLLKAISHQKTLTELNLSGNFLNTNCVSVLCSSLITLHNLQKLNLSCTGLQAVHLSLLANCFSSHSSVFDKLGHLDVSDNIGLTKTCLKALESITNALNLATLNLSNIGLEEASFVNQSDEFKMSLNALEMLDVSSNGLNGQDIKKIVSWIDARRLKKLDVSNNKANGVLKLVVEVFEGQDAVVLETVNLQRCGVTDSNLFELLRLAPNLSTLNLSYNNDLTSISLRRLLEHGRLRKLNLLCCDNIWKYFDISEIGWSIEFDSGGSETVFKVSEGSDIFYDSLVERFREKYPTCKVDRDVDYLCIMLSAK